MLQHAKAIEKMLHDYASISSQEVNFQKFTVFFDKSVPLGGQNYITSILEIPKKVTIELPQVTLPHWSMNEAYLPIC